ncbi:ABC transporter ATP-binding protein [Sphingomonas sp.]|uniref:ABC transporter ATP-binding protein n=1 Tax=Sphingomonas sp. TaxID=28214 RepID=UPI002869F6A6|nr:ABC transporter ATP-binding protein [Sphingomonas sp.]
MRRRILPFVPLVAGLGLLASLLEGAGIGLLVPLLALMLDETASTNMPGPLRAAATLFSGVSLQQRTILFGAAIIGLILLKNVVQAANDCLLVSLKARIGRDLRNGLAKSLLSVDYPFFLAQDTARLTRIVSTDSWFVIEAAAAALAVIPAVTALVVFSVLLALLNLKLFLLVLVGAAVVLGTVYLFERRQRRFSHEFTASSQLLWQRHLTLLQAPRTIRLFGQQRREQQRAADAIERLWQSLRATSYVNAIVNPTVDALIALVFLTLLLVGFWSGMTVPAITAFLLLLTRAQPHAKTISRARIGIAAYEGSMREVDWLLSQDVPAAAAPDHDLRLDRPIAFDNVSFAYPNGTRALDQATLTIAPGATTALLGKSGSGKTTLVNLLCRLIEPQAGEIRLGDAPIGPIDSASWRRRIAVAGQDSDLVNGTVAENIAYGRPEATAAEIEAVARAAGAETFIAALPQGFDTPVGSQGLNLSGGQRQRIGVARALLLNPDLLIFDEATNAVDALSDMEIVKLATEHRHFQTLLIISHRKTTIAACQHGIVLHDGKIVEAGPLSDLAYFRSMAGRADG